MTKEEIKNIVDFFSDTYYTREEIKTEIINSSCFNELVDYIYDASHALAEIKNGLNSEK